MPPASRRLYPNLPDELKQWTDPHQFIARVTKVSDGDTVHVSVQCGFGVMLPEVRVRLLGIDAPELVGVEKFAAKHSQRELSKLILDNWIGLETYCDQTDKHGRYLGVLWTMLNADLVNVNRWMLDQNLAKPFKVNRWFDARPYHLRPLSERCEKCNSFILPTPGQEHQAAK